MVSIAGSLVSKHRNHGFLFPGMLVSEGPDTGVTSPGILSLVVYNLGTGKGYSVLELVEAFERVNGIKIPYVIDGRRAGDVPVVYSDPSKAERELGWRAEYGINEMVRDSWNWQKRNPNGFE